MFYVIQYLLFFIMISMSAMAYAEGGHAMSHDHHAAMIESPIKKEDLELKIISPVFIQPGKNTTVIFRLMNPITNKAITLNDLKIVHTQKLHLLIIDPSLSDYHHVHPIETSTRGEFTFNFIPQKQSSYRIWADVTPTVTDQQQYVMTDIGKPSKSKIFINKKVNKIVNVNGYLFTLKFDQEPRIGQPVIGKITITKDGKPVTQLEPLMGAYAHVVGFTEDYQSVVHIHPMGKEPTQPTDRGGPTLTFHLEPEKVGYVKLFVQVRINGQDLYAPFGVRVGKG